MTHHWKTEFKEELNILEQSIVDFVHRLTLMNKILQASLELRISQAQHCKEPNHNWKTGRLWDFDPWCQVVEELGNEEGTKLSP